MPDPDKEESEFGPGEDWEGTVELTEAVTVPPLSARIARVRVVRRGSPMIVEVPRSQAVLLEPEGLPGVYMTRILATLDNDDASNTSSSDPLVVGKSPLKINEIPPCDSIRGDNADCEIYDTFATGHNGGSLKVGAGECLSRLPGGGTGEVATGQRERERPTGEGLFSSR